MGLLAGLGLLLVVLVFAGFVVCVSCFGLHGIDFGVLFGMFCFGAWVTYIECYLLGCFSFVF